MENVSAIIKRRKRGSLVGSVIVIVFMIAIAASDSAGGNFIMLVFFGIIVLVPILLIYSVNAANYPQPKPYYRTFNKIVYIWGSKIVLVTSVIESVTSLKRAADPFDKLGGGGGVPSKTTDLLDAAVSTGVGYQMYRQLKPAEAVEQYFVSKSLVAPQLKAQPAAPPISASPAPASPETPRTDTTDSSK